MPNNTNTVPTANNSSRETKKINDLNLSVKAPQPHLEFPPIFAEKAKKLDALRSQKEALNHNPYSLATVIHHIEWPDVSEMSAFQPQGLPEYLRQELKQENPYAVTISLSDFEFGEVCFKRVRQLDAGRNTQQEGKNNNP